MRILFFADTHLGIDYPLRRKNNRLYRGDDFFNNFQLLLDKAESDQYDLVIHGGDLFDRSNVPAQIVNRAYDMLFALADTGIPIVLVPGNHDRSTLPTSLFLQHPNLHIYFEPDIFTFNIKGIKLQVAGFPFVRKIGNEISSILQRFSKRLDKDSVSLLLMHQAVEGAAVGPANYVFQRRDDVIAQSDLWGPYSAFLSGHIHPHQVIEISQDDTQTFIPFLYPGSIESTSFAEAGEIKGYTDLLINDQAEFSFTFHPLPHRPLVVLEVPHHLGNTETDAWLKNQLALLDPQAMVRLDVLNQEKSKLFSAARLRELAKGNQLITVRHLWIDRSNVSFRK